MLCLPYRRFFTAANAAPNCCMRMPRFSRLPVRSGPYRCPTAHSARAQRRDGRRASPWPVSIRFRESRLELTGNVRERHFPTAPCVAWGDLVADIRSRAGLVCFDARTPIFLFDASEHRSVGSLRFILVQTGTMSRVKSGCRPIGDRLAFQNCLHIEQ